MAARHKHSKGSLVSWVLKLVVPFVGLGSLGIAMVTLYKITRFDTKRGSEFADGFGYKDIAGPLRGGRGGYNGGDPLRTPITTNTNADANRKYGGDTPQQRQDDQPAYLPDLPNLPPTPPSPPHERKEPVTVAHAGPGKGLEPDAQPEPPEVKPEVKPKKTEAKPKENVAGWRKEGPARDEKKKEKKGFFRSRTAGLEPAEGGGERIRHSTTKAKGGWMGGIGFEGGKRNYVFEVDPENERVVGRVGDRETAVIIDADDPRFAGAGGGGRGKLSPRGEVVPMLGREAVLLVICANRAEYLKTTLDAVAAHHPGSSRGKAFAMPVVLSQDGTNPEVDTVVARFKETMSERAHVLHIHHVPLPKERDGYVKLSAHYQWALHQVFDELEDGWYSFDLVDKVVILEEDLEISPDFFEYFAAMAPLLDSDDTLMAVSAWNDNGQAANVKDNTALVRTDFFPGLGWMLPRRVWDELSPIWPRAYWDDWLRHPDRRKDRQFIRPEVCRTYHFGKKGGASRNQFGSHLDNIKLNQDSVPFREMDLSYLYPGAFRRWFGDKVRKAPTASLADVQLARLMPQEVVVEYTDEDDFKHIASELGIMSDSKAGVPRTAYMGVVSLWSRNTKVYLAPTDVRRSLA